MSIKSCENYFKNEFASRICEEASKWEEEKEGYSQGTILALFIIVSIGLGFLSLPIIHVFSNQVFPIWMCEIVTHPFFIVAAVLIKLFTIIILCVIGHRIHDKKIFDWEKQKISQDYAQLGKRLDLIKKTIVTLPKDRFKASLLGLPKEVFRMSISYLNTSDLYIVGRVDRSTSKEIKRMFIANNMKRDLNILIEEVKIWNQLNELHKKKVEYEKMNDDNWRQWRSYVYQPSYSLSRHQDLGIYSNRFNPTFLGCPPHYGLSSEKTRLMQIHQKFQDLHNQFLPEAIRKLQAYFA